MKKTLLSIIALLTGISGFAADDNTVEIVYKGTTATVSIASNIRDYVTCQSGTSSHVVIEQDSTFAGINATSKNTSGEITYILSGSSTDGEFRITGAFKQTIELNGLTLTNPKGPAINIQNGKRTSLSAKNGTTSTLADGTDTLYNGSIHCKGHLKLKGKGTLNVTGNSKHAIYSKEYMEVKNCAINITSAAKDGMHCKEYFLMESGTVTISGAGSDGIQVELGGTTPTGVTTDHDDEDTGNFYMTDGTLIITNFADKAVKADGTIAYTGGTRNFDAADTKEQAAIQTVTTGADNSRQSVYNLAGQRLSSAASAAGKGLRIVSNGRETKKIIAQ